jgi:peptidoglycan hydrolase CwlO-like protein
MSFKKNNKRRHTLLSKRFNEGLSSEEEQELEQLTKKCIEYMNKKNPLPLDKIKELEQELKESQQKIKEIREDIDERSN